jgi:hypothetical protein
MRKVAINAMNFSSMNNEGHLEFLLIFLSLLEKYPNGKALVQQFLAEYNKQLELEKKLVDAARKSLLTKRLTELDKRIDRDVASIRAAIKSARFHFDSEKVEAALVLSDRLKNFGNIKSKAYEEESTAVKLLVSDFQTGFAAQATAVGIDDLVSELAEAESLFTQVFEARNAELAARPQVNNKELHPEIEAIYRDMISCINNDLLVNGDVNCGDLANELNEQIKYFTEHSRRKSKKDINAAIIQSIPDQKFTGKQIIIFPKVDFEGVELVFATDYTVTYKNNTRVGNATVNVRGKGGFKGTKIITFNITV